MSELYESYASDLSQLRDSITSKLENELGSQSGEARKSTLRRAAMEVEEAEEVLSQMEIEIQSFPQSVRSNYSLQLRASKADVERLSKQIRAALAAPSGSKSFDPFADPSTSPSDLESQSDNANSQRQRLLQGTATLEDSSRRLQDSNRLALETEDLGNDILRDLRSQREQIENTRDTLRQADSNIDRSSKTLTKMIRRAKQQKLVTIGIITVLVLLILLILYSKFR
ncbi:V-snare-domain-containing protein [Violaceomyces palustris]|uniref:V-snare-domain-containing protein n=1 Tax=Violaceomyces palustris TaxID=1673888 RepID=A0ACD0NQG5_9BASI|nr:V-snare-domain-containing protein [Violaceomyces palustris]